MRFLKVSVITTAMITTLIAAILMINSDQPNLTFALLNGEIVEGSITKGAMKYYKLMGGGLADSETELIVELVSKGASVDLFVKADYKPTLTKFDCASRADVITGISATQTNSRLCRLNADESSDWRIGVYGTGDADYTLRPIFSEPIYYSVMKTFNAHYAAWSFFHLSGNVDSDQYFNAEILDTDQDLDLCIASRFAPTLDNNVCCKTIQKNTLGGCEITNNNGETKWYLGVRDKSARNANVTMQASLPGPPYSIKWKKDFNAITYLTDIGVSETGNVVIVGYTKEDVFIQTYEPNGKKVWERTIKDARLPYVSGYNIWAVPALTLDIEGNVYIATPSRNPAGNVGALIAKYSATGDLQWKQIVQSDNAHTASTGICLTNTLTGGKVIYVVGVAEGDYPVGVAPSVQQGTSNGSLDGFLSAFRDDGKFYSTTEIALFSGGFNSDVVHDCAGLGHFRQGVITAGSTAGSIPRFAYRGLGGKDAFVEYISKMTYIKQFSTRWAMQYGSAADEYAFDVVTNIDGGDSYIYLLGNASGGIKAVSGSTPIPGGEMVAGVHLLHLDMGYTGARPKFKWVRDIAVGARGYPSSAVALHRDGKDIYVAGVVSNPNNRYACGKNECSFIAGFNTNGTKNLFHISDAETYRVGIAVGPNQKVCTIGDHYLKCGNF